MTDRASEAPSWADRCGPEHADHDWGEGIPYRGLLGPSLRWECSRCDARAHASGVAGLELPEGV